MATPDAKGGAVLGMKNANKDEGLKIKDKRGKIINNKRQESLGSFSIAFVFYLSSCVFCIFNGAAIDDITAQSLRQTTHSSGNEALFPSRQVENNVAVEFYYHPLPEDMEGFEGELANLIEYVTKGTDQTDQPDKPDAEGIASSFQSPIQKQGTVHVRQGVALVFKVTDATMNWPVQGLIPDCPIRFASGAGNLEATRKQLIRRARLYGGHFPISEYTYLFVLNSLDGTVSVIDTTDFQWTGMPLKKISLSEDQGCKGIDIDMQWLGRYAYVTLDTEEVAVIDCMTLQIIRKIKAGRNPHHVFVQPDGKYAWVCNDGDGTVTVIDADIQEIVKTIVVGSGHHEMAFTPDSHYGCITNQGDDSVTIIDVYALSAIGEITVGDRPHGLGYSSLSQFMYVANEGEGTVSVIDIWSKRVRRTIPVGKGVRSVRFGPELRWGFAPNKGDDTCSIIDVAKDIVVDTIKTGKGPEDVTFVPGWVFIRNTESPDMTVMSLQHRDLITNVPIGSLKSTEVDVPMGHISVVPQGDGHSVLVPNPSQSAVYRYAPGEGAGGTVPSGVYNTQANGSSKLIVYYRGLKEVSNGVFTRTIMFGRPGRYEIGFYVDNPELSACFELNVIP